MLRAENRIRSDPRGIIIGEPGEQARPEYRQKRGPGPGTGRPERGESQTDTALVVGDHMLRGATHGSMYPWAVVAAWVRGACVRGDGLEQQTADGRNSSTQ